MSEAQADYARAFARFWAERHDEHVHVFPNGYVYDRAERRRHMRQNLRAQRAAKADG